MYGFPKTTQGAIRSAWKRAVYTALAGQTVFVLPALADARVALRVWSSATTPPTLLTAYQVRAATGAQCFVAGAMTITSAYANPAAMYDGSTAISAGTTGWPNTVTVDWGTPAPHRPCRPLHRHKLRLRHDVGRNLSVDRQQ